jgi:hypothetical protein
MSQEPSNGEATLLPLLNSLEARRHSVNFMQL